MNGWKFEKFISDVIYDLRQRQLLPVVALLVLAIPVVPIVLSGSDDPAPAGSLAAVGEAIETPETQSAVVAYETGLRNYKKRLGKLQASDPFVQQFGGVDAAVEQVGDALGTEIGSSVSAGGDPGSVGGDPTPPSSPGSPSVPTKTQTRYVRYAVDVVAGVDGQATRRNDIFNPSVLPSQTTQVALFVGLSGDSKSAIFLISSDVASVAGGSGTCLFGTPCGVLMLEKGQNMNFVYSDGKTYRIHVVGIRRILSSSPETPTPPTTIKAEAGKAASVAPSVGVEVEPRDTPDEG